MTFQTSPKLMAQIEADRKARAAEVAKIWQDGLSHKEVDPVKPQERYNAPGNFPRI